MFVFLCTMLLVFTITAFFILKPEKLKKLERKFRLVWHFLTGPEVLAPTEATLIAGGALRIPFSFAGTTNFVYVPYHRTQRARISGYSIYLLKNGVKTVFDQNRAVPIMVTARMLGGESWMIVNQQTQATEVFTDNRIPDLSTLG